MKSPELEALDEMSKQVEQFAAKKADKSELNRMNILLEEISEDVQRSKDGGSGFSRGKSLGRMAVEALKAAGFGPGLAKGQSITVTINKEVAAFTTANVIAVGTDSIPYSLADSERGLTRVVRRRPFLIELANTSRTTKGYVQWSEQENIEGDANVTAEGQPKSQSDFEWVEKSAKVEKVTDFIKVSKESLDDLDGLANDIDTELRELILLKADQQLLSGNGTSPQLNGLLEQTTAFSAGSFAGEVNDINYFDILRVAVSQVVGSNFSPNYILLNPVDVAKMDLSKSSSDGHYVLPGFKSQNGQEISSVRIVENNGIAVGDFVVGDFTKFRVRIREGVTITGGHEDDDFTRNLLTILGEMRLACYVKGVHQAAFVSGNFDEATDLLEGGS